MNHEKQNEKVAAPASAVVQPLKKSGGGQSVLTPHCGA